MGKTRSRQAPPQEVVLDAGALIALERGDRRMIALLREMAARDATFVVPAGALGQAWRDGKTQVVLARFVRTRSVEVVNLDEALAKACGELCAAARTKDVIDASVVLIARSRSSSVISSDPDDLGVLDPGLRVVRI